MIIHNFKQRSPEWYNVREKKMTGSNATAIGANGKGLATYTTELMQEYYSLAEPDNYDNYDMKRGRELEDSASFLYQMKIDLSTEKIGFVEYSKYVGVSPDLFVCLTGMAEIKCPADKVYFKYMMDGKIDSKYLNQMQMQMLCCEKDWCDYVGYNPNYERNIIIKRVLPDYDYWKKLEIGFKSGEKMINEIEAKMAA